MFKVKIEDAVGMVLAHDLTKIVPDTYKGPAFKKGYIIQEADIEELKNIGKNHIYVVTLNEGQIHENDAVTRLSKAVASERLIICEPSEGKSNIRAAADGLLKINKEALFKLNMLHDMAIVTLHDNTIVKKNQIVAAVKIVPLVINSIEIEKAEQICRQMGPIADVIPMYPLKTGIIVTGTEVYSGRIEDRFGDVLKEKVAHYGGEVLDLQYVPDDSDHIYRQIIEFFKKGAEIILISGGMAVDADDVTPKAIHSAAWEVVTYGVPVLPGSMCMIAYNRQVPLVGVPACAMFNKTTVLDLIYPRLLAKEHLKKEDIVSLAHGGMCLHCEECRYPACAFGK